MKSKMHRKYVITDATDKKIEFVVHPEYTVHKHKDFIIVDKDDIELTLACRKNMLEMVSVVNKFMSGNTINKLAVEEVEEVEE